MRVLERAFGHGEPWILEADAIPVLRGIAAAEVDGAEDILNKLETLEAAGLTVGLEIWAEY